MWRAGKVTLSNHVRLVPVQLFSQSALQFVDDALMSAAKAGKKTSKETDEAFKEAVNMLSDYERKYHSKSEETVSRRMEKAEEEDKSSLKVLNRLKEAFCVRETSTFLCRNTKASSQPLEEEPTKTVEFLLHKSLPDKRPTVVKRKRPVLKAAYGL